MLPVQVNQKVMHGFEVRAQCKLVNYNYTTLLKPFFYGILKRGM